MSDWSKGMSEVMEMAHDRALYTFEGETNIHLEPDERVRQSAFIGFESGFTQGWDARAAQAVSLPDRETLARRLYETKRAQAQVRGTLTWDDDADWKREEFRTLADAVLAALSTQPAAGMTADEFKWAIHVERKRQIGKGYTPAHDDELGAGHLVNEAIEHARKGKPVASAALILALSEHIERAAQTVEGEVEWEYAVRDRRGRILFTATAGAVEGDVAVRRTKAGPWIEVQP